MAFRLPVPKTGALPCILYSIVGCRSSLVASTLYCLLSVPGIAADVQVNSPDHNVSNQSNFTTQSETNIAVAGSLVVVGYNSSKQAGLLGPTSWNSFSGYAYSTDGGLTFMDGGSVPSNGNKLEGDPALAFGSNGTTLYYASMGRDANSVSRIFVSPSTSLSPVTFGTPVAISGLTGGRRPLQDHEFIAVDTSNSTFRDRVYVAWTEFPNGDSPNGPSQVLFAASSPATSLAFSPTRVLSAVTAVNHGAMPAVAPNGDVYET